METAPLKSFATWARTSLIREVTARIAVVLAPASPERVEQPNAVQALEKAVTAAGGGDKGKAAVADKVAYTWFNRIIALRFMDTNGYTGVGVVSPQVGVQTGQPEILAEAKRGNFEADVVGSKTRETVTALLNGTRRSDDAQGEAYALLLAEYCRHWNRAMPFMFEREGDFTELLIPANLLADDSVPSRALKDLAMEDWQDVEVIGWLYQFYISERKAEVFSSFKKGTKAGPDEIPAATQLFTPHWIVRYLAENSLGRLWMLNRPTSRLVDQMKYYVAPVHQETDFIKIARPEELKVVDPACGSGHMLTYAFDLLYAIYEEEGYAPAEIPGLILANNLYGIEIDPRAAALAAFALTMKARAKQRTFFSRHIEPNVCVLNPIRFAPDEIESLLTPGGDERAETVFWRQFEHADTFGSLIQPDPKLTVRLKQHLAGLDNAGDILLGDMLGRAESVIGQAEYLVGRYSVAIANPPYMGSKSMTSLLVNFAKKQFPDSRGDLFAMFIERCLSLCESGGSVAMITMQSWMFISSYAALRKSIVSNNPPVSMIHLGERAFDSISGSVVSTTAFVLSRFGARAKPATYLRVTDGAGESAKSAIVLEALRSSSSPRLFEVSADDLRVVPGAPLAYWLSDALRAAFAKGSPLAAISAPRNGLQTSDNAKFLRFWWEVSANRAAIPLMSQPPDLTDARWFPYNKGGEYRRWYGNQSYVVNWENGGAEVRASLNERYPYLNGNLGALVRATEDYFKPHISWSAVGSGSPSFREYPAGLIFDAAANSLFPSPERLRRDLVGVLNSSVTTSLLGALTPTLNFVVGDIAKLPIVLPSRDSGLADLVGSLVDTARIDWDSFETSWSFSSTSWLPQAAPLRDVASMAAERWRVDSIRQQEYEVAVNRIVADTYGLEGEVPVDVSLRGVSLLRNVEFRYGPGKSSREYAALERSDVASELVSYAVGCMFGRYSLDERGLVLADQGATVEDYLAKVPNPTFTPDKDNVIPIVDGDWFEDDVVARFRRFLRAAFGDQHFEENLRFVADSLGVSDVREYFIKTGARVASSKFYDDHVQRYKKRPIYWLFSSPKGSFNALIYMHRYTSSTVSTVLNDYLREFTAKLTSSLRQQERLAAGGGTPRQQAAAQKEADRLRKVLFELEEYEHDVLYPLASRQLAIDLDDGVKANYPKLGTALRKIPGLEASDE